MIKKFITAFTVTIICILPTIILSSCGKTSTKIPSAASSSGAGSQVGSSALSSNTMSSKYVSHGNEKMSSDYQKIQNDVDNGHYPWRLDPEEVAMEYVDTLKIKKFNKSYDKIDQKITDDTATVVFKKGEKAIIKFKLYQPVRKGKTGIWAVMSWTDSKTNTKHTVK